ncbi:MAG: type II secretion system F family protein [Vibrio sp.]
MDSLLSLIPFPNETRTFKEWLFLCSVLLSVILAVMGLGMLLFGQKDSLKRRLATVNPDEITGNKALYSPKVTNTLESLSTYLMPNSDKERETIRHKLMHAGFHQKSAVAYFYAIKFLSTMFFALLSALAYLFFDPDFSILAFFMVALGVGLFVPNIVLQNLITTRLRKIRNGIPDMLDLLVVSTEAGLGFVAAIRRVADELFISHPELADELDTVCIKIKAGVDVSTSFQGLITRTGIEEIRGLVVLLSHAMKNGGGIAKTLRDYADDFRDKRNQEAEEIAAKIPTKMLFPMLIFIWPCFFIVAIGPAVLSLLDSF